MSARAAYQRLATLWRNKASTAEIQSAMHRLHLAIDADECAYSELERTTSALRRAMILVAEHDASVVLAAASSLANQSGAVAVAVRPACPPTADETVAAAPDLDSARGQNSDA